MSAPHRTAIVLGTAVAVVGLVPIGSPASPSPDGAPARRPNKSEPPSQPQIDSMSHTPGVWKSDARITISWTQSTDPVALLGYSYTWDTVPNTLPDLTVEIPATETRTAVSPPLADGSSHFFHLAAVGSDVAAPLSLPVHAGPFFIDTTNPADGTVGGPDLERTFQRAREIEFSFAATDALSGIELMEVRYRQARFNGSFGDFVTLLQTGPSSGVAAFSGEPGTTYCFSVRATDAAGNRTALRPEKCTSVPLDDRRLFRKGRWVRRIGRGYYLGTYSQSRRRGAVLLRGDVRARQLAVVATTCRRCGKIRVYFRNKLVARLNLRSRVTRKRHLFPVRAFPFIRKGPVQIVVASKRKIVRIDGLGVSAQKL